MWASVCNLVSTAGQANLVKVPTICSIKLWLISLYKRRGWSRRSCCNIPMLLQLLDVDFCHAIPGFATCPVWPLYLHRKLFDGHCLCRIGGRVLV